MKTILTWKDKMQFHAAMDQYETLIDAKPPIGSGSGPTPKQLVLSAISGCTGLDVVSLLKKYRQAFESFVIEADASQTEGKHPVVFKEIHLQFRVTGPVEPEKLLEAIRLSQTKFCGVSAMIAKTAPIHYRVELNGQEIGTGQSAFEDA